MTMDSIEVRKVVEALLFASDEPISVESIVKVLSDEIEEDEDTCAELIQSALLEIDRLLVHTSVELRNLSSGIRIQIKPQYTKWVNRLWDRKPPKYSRALLETLALIAYKQPITRGDIEQVRGVQVRTTTIRTLLDRGWIREIGKRQSPGYPSLYGTTPAFLDYFNLQSLDELPPMSDIESLMVGRGTQNENEAQFEVVDESG